MAGNVKKRSFDHVTETRVEGDLFCPRDRTRWFDPSLWSGNVHFQGRQRAPLDHHETLHLELLVALCRALVAEKTWNLFQGSRP